MRLPVLKRGERAADEVQSRKMLGGGHGRRAAGLRTTREFGEMHRLHGISYKYIAYPPTS